MIHITHFSGSIWNRKWREKNLGQRRGAGVKVSLQNLSAGRRKRSSHPVNPGGTGIRTADPELHKPSMGSKVSEHLPAKPEVLGWAAVETTGASTPSSFSVALICMWPDILSQVTCSPGAGACLQIFYLQRYNPPGHTNSFLLRGALKYRTILPGARTVVSPSSPIGATQLVTLVTTSHEGAHSWYPSTNHITPSLFLPSQKYWTQ